MINANPTIPPPTDKSPDQTTPVEPTAPSGADIPAPLETGEKGEINTDAEIDRDAGEPTDAPTEVSHIQAAHALSQSVELSAEAASQLIANIEVSASVAASSDLPDADPATCLAESTSSIKVQVLEDRANSVINSHEPATSSAVDLQVSATEPVPQARTMFPEFSVKANESTEEPPHPIDAEPTVQAIIRSSDTVAPEQGAEEAVKTQAAANDDNIRDPEDHLTAVAEKEVSGAESTQMQPIECSEVAAENSAAKPTDSFDDVRTPGPPNLGSPQPQEDAPSPASDCESVPAGRMADESAEPRSVLTHSASAIGSKAAITAEKPKRKRRKPKPSEFVKTPAPSTADAGALSNTASPPGPAIFEAQPRNQKPADSSYNAPAQRSKVGPSLFEKPPAPSHADVSFHQEASVAQRKAVFSSHASPSMADMNYGSPLPNTSKTSLYVSPPKTSTADTGTYAAGLNCASSVTKSVFESTAKPSLAAVRACDPAPQAQSGPSVFASQPAEPKANARAGVELRKNEGQQTYVFESAPKQLSVAAKWSDPVVPKNTSSIFESKAAPSRADAAADRSLDSGDEYETDTDDE